MTPEFERVALIGNSLPLIAQIGSWFRRGGRYLAVLDEPRLTRNDWANEVIRRQNALNLSQPRRILFAGSGNDVVQRMTESGQLPEHALIGSPEEAARVLRGWIREPSKSMPWGRSNLGLGLMMARRSGFALTVDMDAESPLHDAFMPGGRHSLIACEAGDELAQITASNLAFASNAALLIIPKLPDEERNDWMEALYAVGSDGGNATEQLRLIRDQGRARLPNFPFDRYEQITFITNGFPWGVAVPERPTTHLYAYPDLGRAIVQGLWVSHNAAYSARSALLVEPGQVEGSEISDIAPALWHNRTLARFLEGPAANVNTVDVLMQGLPFDVIVFSTHAGDAPGERVSYKFVDSEGIRRYLVVDVAVGLGFDPVSNQYRIEQHERFHSLDGVLWSDKKAKAQMYIGTAITTWIALGDLVQRQEYRVASEPIERVIGSMGLKMHDQVWFASVHNFAPFCFPVVICNACSSWHELSQRLSYAGARTYIGTLHPVTNVEAQEVARCLFGSHLGTPLIRALWETQNAVYGREGRRPYVMFGLPCSVIAPNPVRSLGEAVESMRRKYRAAIGSYDAAYREQNHPAGMADVAENSLRSRDYLQRDFEGFCAQFPLSQILKA